MRKHMKAFSLEEYYKGKVNVVGLVIKDTIVGKDNMKAGMLFISLDFGGKKIEAQIALDDTPDFKKHIISIVDQASKLKVEKSKDGKK